MLEVGHPIVQEFRREHRAANFSARMPAISLQPPQIEDGVMGKPEAITVRKEEIKLRQFLFRRCK